MTPESERARKKAWKAANREQVRAADAIYRARTKDRAAERNKARYAAKREHVTATNNAWKEANKERIRSYGRARYKAKKEMLLAQGRAYKQANPEKAREIQRRRVARQRGSANEVVDYAAVLRESGGICGICRKPLDLFGTHFDHIIPLAKGGGHTRENIQATHAHCNLSKGARLAA